MSTAGLLAVALIIDALAGEPERIWQRVPHPAVLMGNAIAFLDHRLNRGEARRAKGVLTLVLLVSAAATLGSVIANLPLGGVWSILGCAILLAQKSLVEHVSAVAFAIHQSTAAGRQAVALIVGRDTTTMDDSAIARAAIESAAENLSDGVVAPAFWFLVGGLPGILVYKVVNTADSMIGYRTPRYGSFGWAAARFDDLLNLIPARLTAVLIIAIDRNWKAWPQIVAEARRHRSPNAGWPEAATARSLDVALSGPRSYDGRLRDYPFVNPAGQRKIGAAEITASVRLLWRVWAALLGLIAILAMI